MKILMSWSSGKDSAWAVHLLRQQGTRPAAILTSINEAADRVSMHAVRSDVLRAQADALDLPLITVPLPWPCTNEIYEQRMGAAVRDAVAQGFTHVAFGDLFLEDVRRYREDRLAGTGLAPLFPLWGLPTAPLARDMIAGGIEAHITCLDPRVLRREFAGRRFDQSLLDDLPQGVDPCAECGEFHTCAVGGPMFSKRIEVTIGDTIERDGFVFTDLRLAASGDSG